MSYSDIQKKYLDNETEEETKKKKKKSSLSYTDIAKKYGISYDVDEDYLKSFISDSNAFAETEESKSYGAWKKLDLGSRASYVRGWLDHNKGGIDENTYKSLSASVDNYLKLNDYYSKFETEDDYTSYLKQVEYDEGLKTYDLEAGQKEIGDLEALMTEWDSIGKKIAELTKKGVRPNQIPVEISRRAQELNAVLKQYGGIEGLESAISEKQAYLTKAQKAQYEASLSAVTGNADFDEYSQIGVGASNPTISEVTAPLIIGGWKPFGDGKEIANMVTFAEANKEAALAASGQSFRGGGADSQLTEIVNLINYHMKPEEKGIYNYYIGKGDKKKADDYLAALTDTLRQRQAGKMVEQADQNALELVFSAVAGLDQFASGMKNIGNMIRGEEGDPTSAIQYAHSTMSSNNTGLWGVANDLVTTTSNMLPSILVSTGVNLIAPGAGSVVGTATLGASASGNAYSEMRKLGYDADQASGYAALVGASEAVLQYALGGISKLGGGTEGIFQTIASKIVPNLDKAIARAAIKLGANMLDEGLEEAIQEVLDPVFKMVATGEDFEGINLEEVLYSGLLGALSAGFLEGGSSIAGKVSSNIQASNLYGDKSQMLIDDALAMADGSEAKLLAEKYKGRVEGGKNLRGGQINRLIEATDTAKMKSATETRLSELGETGDVSKLAEIIVKQATGNELSLSEKEILKNSKYAERVANEIDPEKIMSGEYSSGWAENIGTRRANAVAYNKSLYDLARARTGAEQALEKNSVAETLAEAENATESKFKASESGKTIYTENEKSEDVNVNKIVSTKGGKIMVELDNGKTVDASKLSFATAEEGIMYEMVARMEASPETANEIISNFKPSNAKQATVYLAGVPLAYQYGRIGNEAGLKHISLTEQEKRLAYNRGRMDAMSEAESQSGATVSKNGKVDASKSGKGGIIYEGGFTYDESTASDVQKASMVGIETIAKMSSLEVHIYESYIKDGKIVYKFSGREGSAPNGFFTEGNKIYIDINAGDNGEGVMLYTMSHEVTHYIRKWNAKGFKILGDFLIEQYGKHGVPVNALIDDQKKKIKKRYEREGTALPSEAKLNDMAYEELVADAMSDMLADPRAYEKLAKLKKKNRTVWEKLGEAIKSLIDKLKSLIGIYKKYTPDAEEADYVRRFAPEVYEKLQDLYLKAFAEADANYAASNASGLAEIDTKTESVSPVMNSERTWTNSEYVTMRDKAAEKIAKALGVTKTEALKYIDDVNSIARMIANDRVRLDYEASSFGSAFVSNVEYGGSFDYTTLCKKRRVYTGTFTEIQKRLKDTALTPDDILTIRNMLIEAGVEATCGLCYVEGSRANMGKFAKEFIRLYKRDNPNAWIPNMADVNTPDGVEQMRISHPEAYEQYVYFWNHYGKLKDSDPALFASQQKPKLYEARKEYKGEILEHFKGDSSVAKKNRNGGIRMQSFSDFEIVHLIDTMQVIMDMSTVGLAGQAYTKVPEFAKAFGNTGLKINLSLIAKGVDADGKLILDDREGMPHETAFELREKYSKNVGTIIVVFTDAQLLAAMADPRIDFIIPFHRSQWKKGQYGAMGLPKGTKDYTFMQNEKLIKQTYHEYRGNMVKDKASNYMPNEYWDFSKSGKENAEAYLKMCAENNKRPKFYKFLDYDGKGTYSLKADGSTDGYWKLLIDFKMYDNDGAGSPQEAVTPTFNMDEAIAMLDEYKGGHASYPVAHSVVDKFVKQYESKGEVKYSDRDSLDNELSKEQQEFFKDSKVRDKKGNLMVLYHGTTANFNTFKKGDVGFHFGTKGAARGRVGFGKNVTLKEVYLNITNPIVFDEDLGSWDADFRLTRELYDKGILTQAEAESVLFTDDRQYKRTTEAANKKLASVLLEKGYDGIAYSNIFETKNPTTSYIVFNSNQAKDITNKTPTSDPDIRYSDRDPREVTESDVRDVLDNIESYAKDSYFPVRINTPRALIEAAKKRGDIVENLPVVMQVKKAQQAMSDEVTRSSIERAHGLSSDDMIAILKAMDNPTYIVYQENGRYAEIVRFETEGKKRAIAILEIGENKNAIHMNGYEGGLYQILVTAFVPDSYQYIKDILNNKKNTILPIEKKKDSSQRSSGSHVPSLLNESPFFEGSISQNPNSVKREFSDSDEKFSDRDPEGVSNRSLLANALESVAQNDIEKNKLAQYKQKIALIESEQAKLSEIKAQIKEISFAKGARDTEAIKNLQFEANRAANRINTYDKQLINLESTKALKGVLEREKKMLRKRLEQKGKDAIKAQKEKAAETVRELMTRNQESRKKAVESRNKTAIRHKIKDVVDDLNKLLLKPTKEQHVPIGLQLPVAEALDAINMDTMNAAERVAYYNDLIAKAKDPDEIEMLTKKRDFFEYRDANFKERITALKNAYVEFKESDDPLIRNAHNDAIEDLIKNTADAVGNKSLKDMSLEQLEAVHDMYKAILTTVRNANKMFKEGRQATITENSEAVKTEVKEVGGHHDRVNKLTKGLKAFGWNLLKPIVAFKHIGSKTLSGLFDNVRAGEDTYAADISEARAFYRDKADKYKFDSWDFKKRYSFKDSTGTDFSLSLEQIMSLYAYSKREQADRHLEVGGFVFDDAIEVTEKGKFGIPMKYEVNDANPYRLRAEDLATVTSALTADQKGFIDEMQTFLSEVMGEKGNEISLAMYDIKLYKEKNYFPLKTSRYFREYNPEQSGNPMLRNSGFSKKTVPKAGNPIVLSNFMDVWAGHINDMSMYHSFVLPLEDFMRVYNYSSTAGGYDSVQQYIKNAYGVQANQYIEKLMQDINGGVMSGNIQNAWLKMFGKFKKATVAASASTIVQQPTAIARAMAKINPKYFVGRPFKGGHKGTWEEIKRYAPIAIIKEMGGIDVGAGRQAKDYIASQTYKGLGKIKGFFTDSDYRDNVFMWGATKADELGWNSIWRAVKREVEAKQNLKPGTEEFFTACGKRFTEVITQTQVYDSVFARSGLMRDKGDLNKFATSFMGEPMTSLNMIYSAILDAKRGGNKLHAVREIGSVYVSIIGAAAMASIIYALRDDDEDESYLEKYAEALGNKLSSEVWIHNMVPYIRDIASIIEGWDVERPDMSIFADIKASFDKLYKINDDGEFEWKVDFSNPEEVYGAIENFGGSIASAFGLPVKNIMRDTRAFFNGFKAIFDDIKPTAEYVGDAFVRGWQGDEKDKSKAIYDAIVNGDEARLEVYRKGYKTDDSYESAIRKALRENDPRIKEAAQAKVDGDLDEYNRIAQEIEREGHFFKKDIKSAISSEVNELTKDDTSADDSSEDKDEVVSNFDASDINVAFENGDTSAAREIIDDLIKTKVANGKTEKEAKSSLRSSMTSYWKPLYKQAYKSGNSSEMARIRKILHASGLYGSANEVVKDVAAWLKD